MAESKKNEQRIEIIGQFLESMLDGLKELDPEYCELVDGSFWDLLSG